MKHQRCLALACCCAFTLLITSGHAEAFRRSRVLTAVLFAAGTSLHFGGSLLKGSAQNRYDDYLNAAIQADIQERRSAYLARRNASNIMSRVGFGCIGFAVLFSISSQLNAETNASDSENALKNPEKGFLKGWQTHTTVAANRSYRNSHSILQIVNRIRPHYDWQTRKTSLTFRHIF